MISPEHFDRANDIHGVPVAVAESLEQEVPASVSPISRLFAAIRAVLEESTVERLGELKSAFAALNLDD